MRLAEQFINWELRPRGADFCSASCAERPTDLRVVGQDNHIFTFGYSRILREDFTHCDYQRDVETGVLRFGEPVRSSTYKVQRWTATLLIPYGVGELHPEVNYVNHDLLEEEIITTEEAHRAIFDGSY